MPQAAIERLGGKVSERRQPKNDLSGRRRRRREQARESPGARRQDADGRRVPGDNRGVLSDPSGRPFSGLLTCAPCRNDSRSLRWRCPRRWRFSSASSLPAAAWPGRPSCRARPPTGRPRTIGRGPASLPGVVNFADVAERINPAVVNIDAASRSGGRGRFRGPQRGVDDPPDTPRDLDVPRQGAGSGFIVDRERLHPDEPSRGGGRRSDHGHASGWPGVSRDGRRIGPGDRRRAGADSQGARTCRRRRSEIPTSCARASGSARSVTRSGTSTQSPSAS